MQKNLRFYFFFSPFPLFLISLSFMMCSCGNKDVLPQYAEIIIRTPDKSESHKFFGLLDPSAVAQYDCFAVFVEYPDEAGPNLCFDTNGSLVMRPNVIMGSAPPATNLSAIVKTGVSRRFMAIGFRSNLASCPLIKGLNISSINTNISAPFIAGEVDIDIPAFAPSQIDLSISAFHSSSNELSGCDGPDLPWGANGNPLGAPVSLSYPVMNPTYPVGTDIGILSPVVAGGIPSSYSISPALPSGLSIDSNTGVISGTPASGVATATYTVSASNSYGLVSHDLGLEVKTATNMYIVNSSGDGADLGEDDLCDVGGGVCTLRAALEENNAGVAKDIYIPTSVGTISFASAFTQSAAGTYSIGGESQSVIVQGSSNSNRFLSITATSVDIELKNLTLQNFGEVSGEGGVVDMANSSNVTSYNVTYNNNIISTAGIGGGVFGMSGGGGVSYLNIYRSTFLNNSCSVASCLGGVIKTLATGYLLNIQDSTFISNSATGKGGVVNFNGAFGNTHTVLRSYFALNSATDGGGVISTNSAGTEIYEIRNNTFYNNSSSHVTDGGGAILIKTSQTFTWNIVNNTFVNNTASAVNAGGAIDIGTPDNTNVTLINNVFIGNTANGAPNSCRSITTQEMSSSGGNIFDNTGDQADTKCLNVNFHANDNVDTLITAEAPKNNGGSTLTIAFDQLLSPYNGGVATSCPAIDQRGIPRDATCDSGAFEVQ